MWVKTSDKHPEDGQQILCYWSPRKINGDSYHEMMAITYYWKDDGYWYPGDFGKSKPTHWMELPEKPS